MGAPQISDLLVSINLLWTVPKYLSTNVYTSSYIRHHTVQCESQSRSRISASKSGWTSRVAHSFGSNKLYICLSNKCFKVYPVYSLCTDVRPSQDHRILRVQTVRINLAAANEHIIFLSWRNSQLYLAVNRPRSTVVEHYLPIIPVPSCKRKLKSPFANYSPLGYCRTDVVPDPNGTRNRCITVRRCKPWPIYCEIYVALRNTLDWKAVRTQFILFLLFRYTRGLDSTNINLNQDVVRGPW